MVSYLICFQNQKALSYFQAFFFFFFAPPLQRLLQVASRHRVLVASRAAPFILLDGWIGLIQSRWEMFGGCVPLLQTTVTWFRINEVWLFFFALQLRRTFFHQLPFYCNITNVKAPRPDICSSGSQWPLWDPSDPCECCWPLTVNFVRIIN